MFNFIKKLFRQLKCHHRWRCTRNFYGDEINSMNGNRSQWVCIYCDKEKLERYKGIV